MNPTSGLCIKSHLITEAAYINSLEDYSLTLIISINTKNNFIGLMCILVLVFKLNPKSLKLKVDFYFTAVLGNLDSNIPVW